MSNRNSILIVDDEKSNLIYLNHLLSTEYTIYSVRDSKDAVEKAKEYLPDLILLDIIMPDIDGFNVLSTLKGLEETKDIPVVFITGLSDISDEMKGLGSGASDYITKPFSDEIVKLRVKNQIKIVNAQAETARQLQILDKRLKQQTLMTSITKSFISDEHPNLLLAKTLDIIGEFMELAQILLFILDKEPERFVCRNEWINPIFDLKSQINNTLMIEDTLNGFIDRITSDSEAVIGSNDSYLRKMIPSSMFFYDNYIIAPIVIKGEVSAFLNLFKANSTEEWSESEINLVTLVASTFSGVFERESIEHDLNVVLRLKSELSKEKENAERSSRVKSEFLSRMSHELRTPMNIVMGMTNLALIAKTDEKIKDCLNEIDTASKDLIGLIDDILDISDIEKEEITFTPFEFHFPAFLERIFSSTISLFNNKNISFDKHIDPSIPEMLISDETRLNQALIHLLKNAAKFTKEGGVVHFTAIADNIEEDTLTMRIEITDSGIGMSEEQINGLFVPFEPVDGTINRKYYGLGVGLYISKKIAEALGGSIEIISELDKGTTVIFIFKAQLNILNQEGNAPISFAGKTALLVDDVEINREIVIAMLEDTLLAIECAAGGLEAVEKFTANPSKYDIILMDINMPDVDGVQATNLIRSSEAPEGKQIPIVAMTANVLPEQVDSYFAAGMNGHIGKPIDTEVLLRRINMYISNGNTSEDVFDTSQKSAGNTLKYGIAWDDRLLTGNEAVDKQHKQVFKLLDGLVKACEDGTAKSKVKEILDSMTDYTIQHFADEEALQLRYGYDNYEAHKKMHDSFKKTIEELVARYNTSGSTEELSTDVNKVLVIWLVNHIQNEDKKISDFIQAKRNE